MSKRRSQTSLDGFLKRAKNVSVQEDINTGINIKEAPNSAVSAIHQELDEPIASGSGENILTACTFPCCTSLVPVQLEIEKEKTRRQFGKRFRYFNNDWYKGYSWLVLCQSNFRAFCFHCRFARQNNLIQFSKREENAFITDGFNSWKDGSCDLKKHEMSEAHMSSVSQYVQIQCKDQPVISHLIQQKSQEQQNNRKCLVKHLEILRVLLRQGITIRGHIDSESNVKQFSLLQQKIGESDLNFLKWIETGSYSGHDILNEQIELIYREVINGLINDIKIFGAGRFALIADESRDISGIEQLSIVLRWVNVNNQFEVHEDFLGFVHCADTRAESITNYIKDAICRFNLRIEDCKGQAYDGASNMTGHLNGVRKRILDCSPEALPVHCCNHSLNLCLQAAASSSDLCQAAFGVVSELYNLIALSPKKLEQFKSIQSETDSKSTSLKKLCATRWTMRNKALKGILSNYCSLLLILAKIRSDNDTPEAAGKARGLEMNLMSFETYLGLTVCLEIFNTCELLAKYLQTKDISAQEMWSSFQIVKETLSKQRNEIFFKELYEKAIIEAGNLNLEEPKCPRIRRIPARYDSGSIPRERTPIEYFRAKFFELYDKVLTELDSRFDQRSFKILQSIEHILLSSISDKCKSETVDMAVISETYKSLNIDRLQSQLKLLPAVLKTCNENRTVKIKEVTKISTIVDVLNCVPGSRNLLNEVCLLLQYYLLVPMSNATSERSFSVLRRLKTYLRSTMTQKRLNHCAVCHVHKDMLEKVDLRKVAKDFVALNDTRANVFGKFVI